MAGPAVGESTARPSRRQDGLLIGLDVGSTTVKVVCVDPSSLEILWRDYQHHETRQVDKSLELLRAAGKQLAGVAGRTRLYLTGSGSKALAEPLGGLFVQEVNAVALAVEALHEDVGSVIELGGQDAKIIIFSENPETGDRQAICSMNDKCASGTGATIDKCLIKVGLTREEVQAVQFDAGRLHKVAAKCGVFAETDIVNLIKSGIPSHEVICSLADAIVDQNLSLLTRGNTLLHKVLLLGGPNAYLPFLQECWRRRIPETWEQRGHAWPTDLPVEDLIVVPHNAEYYGAYGAVLYGLEEPEHASCFRGAEGMEALAQRQRNGVVGELGGPPLTASRDELEAFRERYSVPPFEPARFEAGETVRAVIGLDAGSTSSKAVLVDESGTVLAKAYQLSKGNPIRDMKDLLRALRAQVVDQSAELEVLGFGATGYAADVLHESVRADVKIVETVAHMMSAVESSGEVDVVCDIGGQDIKVLFLANGAIRDFRLSNQCSAGNGMLLQAMAIQFAVPIQEYADTAFRAERSPIFSYGCAVFLDSDRVNFQKEGYGKEELLAGLAMVLPKNVWQYVVQIPRMAELGNRYLLQGGTQYNLAAVKAQVDYIAARVPGAVVDVHPHCGEAGAIGAAHETLRKVKQRGSSTFVGLDAAIGIEYTTRNDEQTRCRFCPNLCSRTFVDSHTSNGTVSRYISGSSCELGTVESKDALRALVRRRRELKGQFANLVEYEARLAFRHFHQPEPLPESRTSLEEVEVYRNAFRRIRRRQITHGFKRSPAAATKRRRRLRIGIPRVLNLYSTAPLFRTYFETLGIQRQNICFSPPTSEGLFREGARYGAVDPCYPSKVVQAHIHDLLFSTHRPPDKGLDYLFFPSLTHVNTFVDKTMDVTSCPIVAGTPNVMKAAFTKEVDFFAERGVEYVDSALTLDEPNYLKHQMFEIWGQRLGITEDESDFAVEQGWTALEWFSRDLERRGLEVLEQVESENRLALLVLGRPYHADAGMNHGVLEEFQALGYPILSIRSIPKDSGWLNRWFKEDLELGLIDSPLDINDVWPENYSTNSAQKVWAAKFAARHPNVAVLDLSSFKCGHDAPTYGLIDSILEAGGKPSMALHDLDANKPAGSLKIRVKTYAYTLARYEEMLADRAERMSELERRVAIRRRELLAARWEALGRTAGSGPKSLRELDEMDLAFAAYLDQEETVFGISESDLDQEFPAPPPVHSPASEDRLLPELAVARRAHPAADGHARGPGGPLLQVVPPDSGGGCGCGASDGGCSSGQRNG